MRIEEDLYLIEDIFRVGNVSGPRLDHIREQDIAIVYQQDKAFVLPGTGGISVFNKIHPKLRGIWWKCPTNTLCPEGLDVVCDRERQDLRHYSIQPAYKMELQEFQVLLRGFAEKFTRIER